MEAMIIIEFFVAFLLTIVVDGVRTETLLEVLDDMAKNGDEINEIFTPSVNGSLGPSQLGHIYKGILLSLNDEVAMKFTPIANILSSNKEFRMYTYLNAIDRPNVTAYGIPCIYYYGKWNDHTMLAMTLLDSTSKQTYQVAEIKQKELMITFLEFVRIIKYIHSRGIIHHDIALENMLMQNGQGFIFNFGLSRDMALATRTRIQNIAEAKEDFRSFLWAVYSLNSYRIQRWFGFSDEDASQVQDIHSFRIVHSLVASRNRGKRFTGMKRVIYEFREHAEKDESGGHLDENDNYVPLHADATGITDVNGNWIPFYDQLYQVIDEELNNYGVVTSSELTLRYISDPFGTDEWPRLEVDYEYFEKN